MGVPNSPELLGCCNCQRFSRLASSSFGDYQGGRATLQRSCYGTPGIAARVGKALFQSRGWLNSYHFVSCLLSVPVVGTKAVRRFQAPSYARKSSNNAQESSEDKRFILPLTIAAASIPLAFTKLSNSRGKVDLWHPFCFGKGAIGSCRRMVRVGIRGRTLLSVRKPS